MSIEIYQSILEAKQVGILYHFTKRDKVKKILRSGKLKAAQSVRQQSGPEKESLGFVSFSRNALLGNTESGFGSFRLVFDGDRLSNKYRFEQYLMKGSPELHFSKRTYSKRRSVGEAEERIFGDVLLKDGLKSVQYKLQPWEINPDKYASMFSSPSVEESNREFFEEIKRIEQLITKKGYDFDIVEKWEPVR